MTIQEIQNRKEDQTFDCKSILIEPKALAVSIVAFANADGGMIAIGLSDKTRKIEGVDQHIDNLNELLRVPFDFCNPSVNVTYTYLPCRDKNGKDNRILLMEIPASSNLHTNQADEAFMRVGDKSRKLSFDERVQLMYDKGERYYEDSRIEGATIDDVDLDAVTRYTKLIGYSKAPIVYLQENNGFIQIDKKGNVQVSVACILLFGNNPQRFFPRARTRFIRYRGIEEKVGTEMNVIKDVTFEGTILNQIQKTVEYLDTQVPEHTFLGTQGTFVTRREYPRFVLQEMVVNACCHRAYNIKGTEIQIKMFDNRIVFESPGRLPGLVKPTNIRNTHFSRNPKVAQFLKAYHFVKEYGEGIDRVYRELEENGAAAISIRTDDFILKISVPKAAENAMMQPQTDAKLTEKVDRNDAELTEIERGLTEKVDRNDAGLIEKLVEKAMLQGDTLTATKIELLRLIAINPNITKAELSKALKISVTAVSNNIDALRNKYLRRVGPDKGGFWKIINE